MESRKSHNKWLTLMAVAITGFMVMLDTTIVNITYPQLTKVFATDASVVLWVTVAYVLVSAGLTPIFGRAGDMVGRKKIYIIGLITFTIGLVVASLSQSIFQLITARIIQGIGSAMNMALSFAIVTDAFAENERGKALGITSSVLSVGPVVGPALGGVLVDTLGWQAIFYLQIPVAIIALIMAWIFLHDRRIDHTRSRLDLWGAGTIFVSLACFTLLLNLSDRLSLLSLPMLGLAAGGIVAMVLFVIQERRVAQPIVNLSLFKIRNFLTGNIGLFITGATGSAHMFLTPFYLIDGVGYSSSMSGLFLAMVPILGIGIGPIAGSISDKIGSRLLCIAGASLLSLGLFLFSRLDATVSNTEIIVYLGVFGLGIGLFITPNTSQVMGSLSQENLGIGSAMINTLRQIGSSTGTALAGAIYASRQAWYYTQYAASTPDTETLNQLSLIGGYQDAMLIAALFCAIAIVSSIVSSNKPSSG